MRKLLMIICMMMFAAFVFNACSSNQDAPKDVVREYYEQFKNGNFEKALSYTAKSDQEIKKEVEKLEGFKLKLKSYEIISEEIAEDGKSAKVKVRFIASSDFQDEEKEQNEVVRLEKINGIWKIK